SGLIHLESDGDFDITVNGNVLLGSRAFGLEGNFGFHIFSTHTEDAIGNPYYKFGMGVNASVKAYVFGITLASVGLAASFSVEGAGTVPIVLHVEASISFLFF